jgi:hypothetical protein
MEIFGSVKVEGSNTNSALVAPPPAPPDDAPHPPPDAPRRTPAVHGRRTLHRHRQNARRRRLLARDSSQWSVQRGHPPCIPRNCGRAPLPPQPGCARALRRRCAMRQCHSDLRSREQWNKRQGNKPSPYGADLARRKPRVSRRSAGVLKFRSAERTYCAPNSHPPPRKTRLERPMAPMGSVIVLS